MSDIYGDFAELYDEATETDNPAKIKHIRQWIAHYNPQTKTLLEIACGTGNILAGFPDFERTGIDLSVNMLTMAAAKLPEVELLQGDMTDFELSRQFDVILCMFNSLNHLLEFEQWQQTFTRAAAHLAPDGLFIFEINTPDYPDRRIQDGRVDYETGSNEIVSELKWERPGVYAWHITVDEAGEQRTIVIPEAVFSLRQVEKELQKHFKLLEKKPDDELDRAFFVCRNQ